MSHGILKEKKRDGGYVDHPLDKAVITLGRSKEADIVINDSSVSRLHFRIENRSGHFYIFDNNSSNGTYVNKKKVSESVMTDGDDIIAGRVQFYFAQKAATADDYLMGDTAETPRSQLAETIETPTVRPEVYGDTPKVPQPTAGQPPVPGYAPPPQPTAPAPPAYASAPPPPSAPPAPQAAPAVPTPPSYGAPPPPSAPPTYGAPPPPAPTAPPAPGMPAAPSYQAPPYGQMPGAPIASGDATPASPIYRLLAQIIDGVIIGVAYGVIIGLMFVLPSWVGTILSLLAMFGVLGYVIIGWMKFGKTLGKHFLGLEIIEVDNPGKTGLGGKTILMRLLGQFLCALPFYLGFLTILFDPEGRGFHDKLANTQVVKR